MKKIWKTILCGALTLTTLLSLTACTKETVINAYDIAVKNGFVGTEQEWLQSLHGADGEDGKARTGTIPLCDDSRMASPAPAQLHRNKEQALRLLPRQAARHLLIPTEPFQVLQFL